MQTQQCPALFDHLVGGCEQCRWNSQPKRLRGLTPIAYAKSSGVHQQIVSDCGDTYFFEPAIPVNEKIIRNYQP